MPETRLVGIDGSWTAVTNHNGVINRWAATGSQFIYNTPGFGDSFMSRRGGLLDFVGSAGGWMRSGTGGGNPMGTATTFALSNTSVDMVLTVNTLCTYTFKGIMVSVGILSDLQSNENNLVFNWANAGAASTTITVAWVTT